MKSKHLAIALLFTVGSLAPMGNAQAQFNIYRDTNAFFSALTNLATLNSGNTFTTNFASFSPGFVSTPMSLTNSPLGYQATVPESFFVSVESWGSRPALATIAVNQALLFTNFSASTRAFGAYLYPTDFNQSPTTPITNATINITATLDDLSFITVTTNVASISFNDYYFGFISTNSARSIVSVSTTVNTNVGASFATGSEVTISTVPEPSTYALLALAAAGLAGHVLRRRRA